MTSEASSESESAPDAVALSSPALSCPPGRQLQVLARPCPPVRFRVMSLHRRRTRQRSWPRRCVALGILALVMVMGIATGSFYLRETDLAASSDATTSLPVAQCIVSPPAGWSSPYTLPARDGASMAYDSALGEIVLFGGYTGAAFLGDTWTFKGGCWTEYESAAATAGQCTLISTGATVSCPAPSTQGAMAYDPSTPALILFPGDIGGTLSQQTWEFTSSGWSELTCTAATCPPAQFGPSMATDPLDNQALLIDGCLAVNGRGTCTTTDGALWAFHSGAWTQLCSGSTTAPACSPEPAARFDASLTYDSHDLRVVLFGGTTLSTTQGDTWEVHGSTPGAGVSWVEICTGTATAPTCSPEPSARFAAYSSDEQKDGYVLMYGGYTTADQGDTWEFSGTTPGAGWTQCTSCSGPGTRDTGAGNGMMTYDYATGDSYAVLFGGESGTSYLSDTWIFE